MDRFRSYDCAPTRNLSSLSPSDNPLNIDGWNVAQKNINGPLCSSRKKRGISFLSPSSNPFNFYTGVERFCLIFRGAKLDPCLGRSKNWPLCQARCSSMYTLYVCCTATYMILYVGDSTYAVHTECGRTQCFLCPSAGTLVRVCPMYALCCTMVSCAEANNKSDFSKV